MASLQGWWVRETYIRAIETLAPPALAGLAAGAVYRGVTAPLSRARFLYTHRRLLSVARRAERLRYLLFNQAPPMWPLPAMNARPMIGAAVPFPFAAAAAFAVYHGGKQMWITKQDTPRSQVLKSIALGAAAGHMTRLFFVTKAHYRMVMPSPYLATALPLYDALRPNHSILATSLAAALAGSLTDGLIHRVWPIVLSAVHRSLDPMAKPQQGSFRSMGEFTLWGIMQSSRAVPRALLLGSLDFFLTLIQPFQHHARTYLTPSPTTSRGRRPTSATPAAATPAAPAPPASSDTALPVAAETQASQISSDASSSPVTAAKAT